MSLQTLVQLKKARPARELKRGVCLSTDRRGKNPADGTQQYSMRLSWAGEIGDECGIAEGCLVDVMFDREHYKGLVRLSAGGTGRKVYRNGKQFLIMCPMEIGLPSAAETVICQHTISNGVLSLDIPRCVSFDLNLRETVAAEVPAYPQSPSVPPTWIARLCKAVASFFRPVG